MLWAGLHAAGKVLCCLCSGKACQLAWRTRNSCASKQRPPPLQHRTTPTRSFTCGTPRRAQLLSSTGSTHAPSLTRCMVSLAVHRQGHGRRAAWLQAGSSVLAFGSGGGGLRCGPGLQPRRSSTATCPTPGPLASPALPPVVGGCAELSRLDPSTSAKEAERMWKEYFVFASGEVLGWTGRGVEGGGQCRQGC